MLSAASALAFQPSPQLVHHVAAELTHALRADEPSLGSAMAEDLVALSLTRTATHPSLNASRVNRRLSALSEGGRRGIGVRPAALSGPSRHCGLLEHGCAVCEASSGGD